MTKMSHATLQSLINSFTASIHASFDETLCERANYLRTLFTVTQTDRYLDIGARSCVNTMVFGAEAQEIIAVDLAFTEKPKAENLELVKADGTSLPFREGAFTRVSLFSVLEHVPDAKRALKQTFKVLKPQGELLLQIPNRYFPLELHTGLPLIFLMPSSLRKYVLKACGYNRRCRWIPEDIPSIRAAINIIKQVKPNARITSVQKVIYPKNLITPKLRRIAQIAKKLGIFNIFPYGYVLTVAY